MISQKEFMKDTYRKSIKIQGEFTIKITHKPSDIGMEMPREKYELYISLEDFPNLDLKIQQRLSFRIVSAESANTVFFLDYLMWNSKIIILKLE